MCVSAAGSRFATDSQPIRNRNFPMAFANATPTGSQTPQGDVTYTYIDPVTSAIATGTASSIALCRASPVWRNFLYPPWKDTRFIDPGSNTLPQGSPQYPPPSVTTIDFTEDSYPALKILLDLAHGKIPTQDPGETPLAFRHDLAVLCDMYDCVELVKPLLRQFYHIIAGGCNPYRSKVESLMLAWVYGDESIFKILVHHVTKSIRVTRQGDVVDRYGHVSPPDLVLPPGLLDFILHARLEGIDVLLSNAYTGLERLQSPNSVLCKRPHCTPCDQGLSSVIERKFKQIGIWPKIRAEDYEGSFDDLQAKFAEFSICSEACMFVRRQHQANSGPQNPQSSTERLCHICIENAPNLASISHDASVDFPIPEAFNRHTRIQEQKRRNAP